MIPSWPLKGAVDAGRVSMIAEARGRCLSRNSSRLRAANSPIPKMHTSRANSCVNPRVERFESRRDSSCSSRNLTFPPAEPESVTRAERLSASRVYEAAMRIRTDGKFAYREELVDDVADRLNENTRVGAVEASAEFTQAMLPALEQAVEHPDMTEELAEILSTRSVDVEYCVETGVNVD